MSEIEGLMIIGIKYCGGCNPDYDRVALVEEMASRPAVGVRFVQAGAADSDIILAVQGCATACADLSAFEGARIIRVTSPAEGEGLIQLLASGDMSAGLRDMESKAT